MNFYGFVYFFAFLFFYWKVERSNLKNKDLYFALNVFFLIIFARIFHVIFEFDYYKLNFVKIFYLWEGGLSFYGGFFGVILANYLYYLVTKENKSNLKDFLENFIVYLPIFIFFGRIANFVNEEHFGVFPFLPQQIFEAIMHGLIPFLFLFFIKKNRIVVFIIVYTATRFITELFRYYFGLKPMHFFIVSFGFITYFFFKKFFEK